MAIISNLVISRDERFATAVWLEDHTTGRHKLFLARMSDAEIKAAIVGESASCERADQSNIVDEGAGIEDPAQDAQFDTNEEEIEPKRNSRTQARIDKRKLKAKYLRDLKKHGIDLSAERSFSKIESAWNNLKESEK